jgi:hypothetical protein
VNLLVVQSSGKAAKAGTGNTTGILGIDSFNDTTNSMSLITYAGASQCTFDAGGVTQDHAFGESTTTAGDCLDLGTLATACAASAQVLGQVTNATTAGTGTYTVNLRPRLCGP